MLQVTEKQHPAHQEVRRDLRKCFRDINCYLMPHPGFKVIQKADFDGRLSGMYTLLCLPFVVFFPHSLGPKIIQIPLGLGIWFTQLFFEQFFLMILWWYLQTNYKEECKRRMDGVLR